MASDGLLADEQLVSDRVVGHARGQESKNLCLALAESARRFLGRMRAFPEAYQRLCRAQLLEQLTRRFELDLSAVAIAELIAGQCNQAVRLRFFVRRLRDHARFQCPAKRHPTPRPYRPRPEARRPWRLRTLPRGTVRPRGGDVGELVGGSPRRHDVADGQQDLDGARQATGALVAPSESFKTLRIDAAARSGGPATDAAAKTGLRLRPHAFACR